MPGQLTSLNIPCPVCGAMPQETCKLVWGGVRNESHIERKWIAQDINSGKTAPPQLDKSRVITRLALVPPQKDHR